MEGISCSIKAERPEIALEALVNVRSVVQRVSTFAGMRRGLPKYLQKIDSIVEQMDRGSHKDDGAEGFKVPSSPQNIPVVPEPTDFQEEDTPSYTSDDDDGDDDDDDDDDASQGSDPDTSEFGSEESDSTDDSESTLPDAIYDKADGVYRCRNIGCGWELLSDTVTDVRLNTR